VDEFLLERQAGRTPGAQGPVRHAKFAFLLAVLLCAVLIAVGCTVGSAPDEDAAVPDAAAAEQEEADTASREPAAAEASAEDAEVEAPEPEPVSEPEPVPDEAVVEEPPDWTTHAFVDGGYYVLGNPEAEVSILDAGDFL
jgi:hypothetical protein